MKDWIHIDQDGFTYRWITASELDEYYEFSCDVYSSLPDKSLYIMGSLEDLKEDFKREVHILGVYRDEKLVAYRQFRYPMKEEENLATILGLDIPVTEIVILDGVMVHENSRGNNLQFRTGALVVSLSDKLGRHKFFSTVSPYNTFSFNNVLKMGFVILDLRHLYKDEENPEGFHRYILYRNARKPLEYENVEVHEYYKDVEKISSLLGAGWVGTEFIRRGEKVVFRKPKNKELP